MKTSGVFVFLALLTLAACKEISFREPQPKGKRTLAAFPKSIQGKYLSFDDAGKASKDTIIVTEKGYHLAYFSATENLNSDDDLDRKNLGDSLVLKSWKGYYFLNFNEKPEWNLRAFKKLENGDLLFMTPGIKDLDFDIYLEKLATETPVDSLDTGSETLYQIDPSPKQLIALIKKGYFTNSVLKKIE